MRFRLVQARLATEVVREEERHAFANKLGVSPDALELVDALSDPLDPRRLCKGVDGLLVGGSGKFSIYDDAPWIPRFVGFLGEVAEAQFPMFASCFGFQGLAVALGAEVRADPDGAEVGSFDLVRRAEAADDPLFGALPEAFVAQQGHKDRALSLPDGAVWLASSERCPYQAMRIGDRVWATQFHPELSADENKHRYLRYKAEYGKAFGGEDDDDSRFRPSASANGLLRAFADHLRG